MAARRGPWRSWGTLDDQLLADMRREGSSALEMALALGRTEAAISQRCARLPRLPHGQVRHQLRRERWAEVLASGITEREAARIMGCTIWGVKNAKQALRRRGLLPPAQSCPMRNQHGPYQRRA